MSETIRAMRIARIALIALAGIATVFWFVRTDGRLATSEVERIEFVNDAAASPDRVAETLIQGGSDKPASANDGLFGLQVTTHTNRVLTAFPEGRLADVDQELKSKAQNGDSTAALQLARSYERCLQAPPSLAVAEIMIEKATLSRRVPENVRSLTDEKLEAYSNETRNEARFCAGVPKEELADFLIWKRMAADNGSIEAQVDFRRTIEGPKMTNVAIEIAFGSLQEFHRIRNEVYLKQAVSAGSGDALITLGAIGRTGSPPALSDFEARAHYIAGVTAKIAAGFELDPLYERMATIYMSQNLSPYDAEVLTTRVQELLSSNDCCFFYEPSENSNVTGKKVIGGERNETE